MISCFEQYTLDPTKLKAFEHFAIIWIPLVERYDGRHHGFFLPSTQYEPTAVSIATFASRAAYDAFLSASETDRECQAAIWYLNDTKCVFVKTQNLLIPLF